jgi:predicted CopG family antitoxin
MWKPGSMKTIEVDSAALARLKAARQDDESWSDVIKRYVKPKASVDDVLAALRETARSLSPQTLEALDETITRRRARQRRRRT